MAEVVGMAEVDGVDGWTGGRGGRVAIRAALVANRSPTGTCVTYGVVGYGYVGIDRTPTPIDADNQPIPTPTPTSTEVPE
jgi:hypothetical protein